ncbi:hypothetical protein GNI_214870 [Gregarina niphandrodes]|uniref:Uncharacterized protein n=1 Tax=Gregarina niphandrodes TaxID=110365 RepID=A0A023AVX5_GRENI|nr:hypothetical protein GNI_214870 [Gregarina niphandrodes]EZG42866.1 hypothetical protein GNI_214870 [Gregarina niphandrodes]|eukprot:XP_011133855.1 hypothetical protein GNI_214870 [Gregarina niphandrodes]
MQLKPLACYLEKKEAPKARDMMIDKGSRGHLALLERGEILRPGKDTQMRKLLSRMFLLIKD